MQRKVPSALLNELKTHFSKENFLRANPEYKPTSNFSPFCNEQGFSKTIQKLAKIQPADTDKLPIAVIIGESNFLSMLPELVRHADVLLLNDIDHRVHAHTQHQLQAMNLANNRKMFMYHYQRFHPLVGIEIIGSKGNAEKISFTGMKKGIESNEYSKISIFYPLKNAIKNVKVH